jgi:hypothetical protein
VSHERSAPARTRAHPHAHQNTSASLARLHTAYTAVSLASSSANSSHTPLLSASSHHRSDPATVAVENSGLKEIRHRENRAVAYIVFVAIGFIASCVFGYLMYYAVGKAESWTMEATLQNVGHAVSSAQPSAQPHTAIRTTRKHEFNGHVNPTIASEV